MKKEKWGSLGKNINAMKWINKRSPKNLTKVAEQDQLTTLTTGYKPAKSTRFITLLFFVSDPESASFMIWSNVIVTTVWALLLVAFILVEATVLLAVPVDESNYACLIIELISWWNNCSFMCYGRCFKNIWRKTFNWSNYISLDLLQSHLTVTIGKKSFFGFVSRSNCWNLRTGQWSDLNIFVIEFN